ncbi:MAG: hypothetical protein WCZ23_07065 [Rhodospirillaceae bacterium]
MSTDSDRISLLGQRVELAREGFTIIRNLLRDATARRSGWQSLLFRFSGHSGILEALELAEALHNLPRGSEPFQEEMTYARLHQYVGRYPSHAGLLRCCPPSDDEAEKR